MAKVYVSAVIAAPVDRVWARIRDYNGLPAWHPMVAASAIEGGKAANEVGAVRALTLQEGGTVREELLAFDEPGRSVTYNILEAPMPIRGYVSTLRLHRVTDGNATFAEWSSEFDVTSGPEAEMVAAIAEVYRVGFDSLKKLVK